VLFSGGSRNSVREGPGRGIEIASSPAEHLPPTHFRAFELK